MPLLSSSRHRVSIIGAGKVGSTLAQRIVEKNLADVVLLDVVAGMPQGIALDISEARGIERHNCEIMGTTDYADTAGSDIVAIAAGFPRKPGITRDELLKTNAEIVIAAAKQAIAHSPTAILIIITNPLDALTYLAWKATGLPSERVIGMAGMLDSARLQTFITEALGVGVFEVNAMVLGGHGDLMVPLPRYCTVNGIPISELMDTATIEKLVNRTRNGGGEIVQLLKTGGAYYAPAAATAVMIAAILGNQSRLLPACAYLDGKYGLTDIFVGVPCRLGSSGVESVVELPLTETELADLHASAQSVRKNIHEAIALLENF